MISNFKDFKNYLNDNGIGFIVLAIINLVVFNFRIQNPTLFARILMSSLMLSTYIIGLIVVVNFTRKQFQIIFRMTKDRKEEWNDGQDLWNYTKEERIEHIIIKLLQYATSSFLIIDLTSIIFYRNSVILEMFSGIIKFFLNQSGMAG